MPASAPLGCTYKDAVKTALHKTGKYEWLRRWFVRWWNVIIQGLERADTPQHFGCFSDELRDGATSEDSQDSEIHTKLLEKPGTDLNCHQRIDSLLDKCELIIDGVIL